MKGNCLNLWFRMINAKCQTHPQVTISEFTNNIIPFWSCENFACPNKSSPQIAAPSNVDHQICVLLAKSTILMSSVFIHLFICFPYFLVSAQCSCFVNSIFYTICIFGIKSYKNWPFNFELKGIVYKNHIAYHFSLKDDNSGENTFLLTKNCKARLVSNSKDATKTYGTITVNFKRLNKMKFQYCVKMVKLFGYNFGLPNK
jgi:hypothetical protein